MTNKRKAELFDQILGWAMEHDMEFVNAMLDATNITYKEKYKLSLIDFYPDYVSIPIDFLDCYSRVITNDKEADEALSAAVKFVESDYKREVKTCDYTIEGTNIVLENIVWKD